MGWTGIQYRGENSHTTFTRQDAIELIRSQFYDYELACIHLKQANDNVEHNVIYTVQRKLYGNGKIFIGVVLVDIEDGELLYKEMDETVGPSYYDCPIKFFDFVKEPPNELAKNWREQVRKQSKEVWVPLTAEEFEL